MVVVSQPTAPVNEILAIKDLAELVLRDFGAIGVSYSYSLLRPAGTEDAHLSQWEQITTALWSRYIWLHCTCCSIMQPALFHHPSLSRFTSEALKHERVEEAACGKWDLAWYWFMCLTLVFFVSIHHAKKC